MSLVFPPLMHGYELDKPAHDPFEVAKSKAIQGVEAGLVVYNLTHEALRATFIFHSRSFTQQSNDYVANMRYWLSKCSRGSGSP